MRAALLLTLIILSGVAQAAEFEVQQDDREISFARQSVNAGGLAVEQRGAAPRTMNSRLAQPINERVPRHAICRPLDCHARCQLNATCKHRRCCPI